MNDTVKKSADDAAEKAYAAASEAVKAEPAKAEAAPAPAAKKSAAKKTTAKKPVAKRTRKTPAKAAAAPKKAAVPRKAPAKAKPAAKVAAKPKIAVVKSKTTKPSIKESIMDMKMNIDGVKDMVSKGQTKAKEMFEKGQTMFGDYSEFTKGNLEAMVESGKILSEGMQDLGTSFVAESRTAFETMSSDMKEMAAAKSPTDILKVQSDMVRKNFDSAVAFGSKNTEAMLKLVSDVAAPISGRVNIAVDKVRKTAA